VTDQAPSPIAPPPGWYLEPPTGRQRWWDGIQWAFYPPEGHETGAVRPIGSTGPTPAYPYAGVAYPATYPGPTNGLATASLVLGIVGVVMCTLVLPSVLAVVFGIVGVTTANRLGGAGKAKAVWGLALGGIALVVLTVAFVANLTS
jgi:hypothetical protein